MDNLFEIRLLFICILVIGVALSLVSLLNISFYIKRNRFLINSAQLRRWYRSQRKYDLSVMILNVVLLVSAINIVYIAFKFIASI